MAPLSNSSLANGLDLIPESESARGALERLAGRIARLERIANAWDEHHAGVLAAIKSSIEELNCEALRRLIRHLRTDPACAAQLSSAVRDPLVFGVLKFHGLVKDPLEHRVQRALEEVRPCLRAHGGNVELVAVVLPDAVDIRLVGACQSCPAPGRPLAEDVERAIRAHCPEIRSIRRV